MIGHWEIQRDGERVYLLGPGECEIVIDRFDPSKVDAFEKSAEELGIEERSRELFAKTMIRVWWYPLERDAFAFLRLTSFRDAARPGQRTTHYLEVKGDGWEVRWMVREDFAESLHALGT